MGNSIGESYLGGGSKVYISPAQIRRMKKNMKKVPKIQDKAQHYAQKEGEIADEWFDKTLENLEKL
ncbi:MAG: hypothetical protein CR971_00485 [candidate division SR1 bacterium]|nr:MAG: hypothetical protein CR971_00485 [candidate division SR1 bacterium]